MGYNALNKNGLTGVLLTNRRPRSLSESSPSSDVPRPYCVMLGAFPVSIVTRRDSAAISGVVGLI